MLNAEVIRWLFLQPSAFSLQPSAFSLFIIHPSLIQQFAILFLLQVVDDADVLIGHLLHFIEPTPLVVFRDAVILEQFLQAIVGIAAHLADAVASVLRVLVNELGQFLPALFRQRGNRDANDFAVVGRI